MSTSAIFPRALVSAQEHGLPPPPPHSGALMSTAFGDDHKDEPFVSRPGVALIIQKL